MNYKLFAGIDISKDTIDVAFFLVEKPDNMFHQQFKNTISGFLEMLEFISTVTDITFSEMFFCAEDTGLYTRPVCSFFTTQEGNLWIENALQLKRSLGIRRGKSDKADAHDIARYGFLHQNKARLFVMPDADLLELKSLISCRRQLVKQQSALKTTNTGLEVFDEYAGFSIGIRKDVIAVLEQNIKRVDERLLAVIKQNEKLSRQFALVRSVYCIGAQTALFMVVFTQGFTTFTDPRKFACYGGLVPFENSSGSSLKGKPRVSHLANKKIKTLLTMCALNTLKKDNEFKRYYDRKISEGKHHSSVLNSIRNKLVFRAFAAVRNNRPYVMEYSLAA